MDDCFSCSTCILSAVIFLLCRMPPLSKSKRACKKARKHKSNAKSFDAYYLFGEFFSVWVAACACTIILHDIAVHQTSKRTANFVPLQHSLQSTLLARARKMAHASSSAQSTWSMSLHCSPPTRVEHSSSHQRAFQRMPTTHLSHLFAAAGSGCGCATPGWQTTQTGIARRTRSVVKVLVHHQLTVCFQIFKWSVKQRTYSVGHTQPGLYIHTLLK
jgi:hypothetical protein